MLRRLSITNYLLIESLELELGRGLSILTGETGSGKSIVVGALGLALGDRADAGLARDADKRCIIELEVDPSGLGLEDWFNEHGLPTEPDLLIRRQLDPGGRSRAFVNDTPVRLEQLRTLGERLVHVHSQHQTLLLNDGRFQLALVDHVAGQKRAVADLAQAYRAWHAVADELESMRAEEARSNAELDYLDHQVAELDRAAIKEGEEETLEQALARAEHAGDIKQALQNTEAAVNGDRAVLSMLGSVRGQLAKAAQHDGGLADLLQRLDSTIIELKDLGAEAGNLADGLALDPKEAEQLRERLDLILRLQQKLRVKNTAELLLLANELRDRAQRLGSLAGRIAELEGREAVLHGNALVQAERISAARTEAMPRLARDIVAQLKKLGMPHAQFTFAHAPAPLGPTGVDDVQALFSANKDRTPEALGKVASGGELGRVMLALLSLSAESLDLPTMVFDEIDSGVSGEVADRVGSLLAAMARDRQVIAITHLPQIASKADVHLLVTKDHEAEVVHSTIRPLNSEERVQALAQMLSGKKTTKAAVDNARELLKGK